MQGPGTLLPMCTLQRTYRKAAKDPTSRSRSAGENWPGAHRRPPELMRCYKYATATRRVKVPRPCHCTSVEPEGGVHEQYSRQREVASIRSGDEHRDRFNKVRIPGLNCVSKAYRGTQTLVICGNQPPQCNGHEGWLRHPRATTAPERTRVQGRHAQERTLQEPYRSLYALYNTMRYWVVPQRVAVSVGRAGIGTRSRHSCLERGTTSRLRPGYIPPSPADVLDFLSILHDDAVIVCAWGL